MRTAEVQRFVRASYGIRGTLSLHRKAFGWDLLRAPVNVALSPVFVVVKLFAALLSLVRAGRLAAWLSRRNIFLKSDMARYIETELLGFVTELRRKGLMSDAAPAIVHAQISQHIQTRNAVAEITTSLLVLTAGLLIFNRATPGIISLVGPMAEMRAYSSAVNDFLLGRGLGHMWYGIFPVELTPAQVLLTGIVLAVIGSVVTTFAGLISDPVQVLTGTHRRRVLRLLSRIEKGASGGLEREHVLARIGDLSDTVLVLWRSLRN